MDKQLKQHILYWENAALKDWRTAEDLFKTKHYDACLFFCHLTLEKQLKGLVVKNRQQAAPYLHNLEKLAELADLEFTLEQRNNFREITKFNIAGRYGDIKRNLYKLADRSYTENYLNITKRLFLWLKKQYQKN
ncbi:MAG: HEPN domain-containing protein [Parcubacteria group bacterium]|nr:HEPN domain-containing protein [Parcubacteria group bacterium]